MGSIQVGSSLGSLSVDGYDDAQLSKCVSSIKSGIAAGRHGFWLSTAPKEANDEIGSIAEGAGLVWVPFTSPIKITFDAEETPSEVTTAFEGTAEDVDL